LGVNILAYDYSGYGLSTGTPTMRNTLADGEAVLNYLTSSPEFKDSTKFIILYGQSLGSGITFHLAKKFPTKISGVVIHSGLMSALRVIQEVPKTKWFDIYPNIDIVKHCMAPLFVIHGTEDVEIPVTHGQALITASPNAYKPWFVEGAGHNNIEIHWREALFKKLAQFIKDVEEGKAKTGRGTHVQDLDISPPSTTTTKKPRTSRPSSPNKERYVEQLDMDKDVTSSEREAVLGGNRGLRFGFVDNNDRENTSVTHEDTTPTGTLVSALGSDHTGSSPLINSSSSSHHDYINEKTQEKIKLDDN